MSAVRGFAMSVVVRRAFVLMLLAGAVGASLALPAIFDGSQLANRGPLPTATTPTTTRVLVSFPVAKPHRTFNAPLRGAVATLLAARHVAPVVRPRVRVAPALPAAPVTPVSPPAAPAQNPAPDPATTPAPVLAPVSNDHFIASAPVPAVPAVTEGHGEDHGHGGNGQGDNKNWNGSGDGEGD
jgi:hypothetical protein